MQSQRDLTSLLIFLMIVMILMVTVWGDQFRRSGQVSGTVLIRSRPVRGGSIFFETQDPGRSEGTVAPIDSGGRFECNPDWRRASSGRTRFRVSVVLDRRYYTPDAPRSGPDHPGTRGPGAGTPSREQPGVPEAAAPPQAPGNVKTLDHWIELGPEPTHLHIELRD